MAKGLFIRKKVCVPLHRQVEALCKDVVPGTGRFFGSFYVQLIGLVAHGLAQVRVCLQPHLRSAHFLNAVQLVVPDRDMWVYVLPLQDAQQFHFDVVAASVAHRALAACRNDQVVLVFRRALLNGTNGVFPDVTA